MPKGSETLKKARREEIIDACQSLYETMSFKEVTIKEIGKVTSFTRTSIYNYFKTKEEIFLALIAREFLLWAEALEAAAACDTLTPDDLAETLAETLSERQLMLKIMSVNMFEIEAQSSLEQLIEFKKAFWRAIDAMDALLAKLPSAPDADTRKAFTFSFFPFMYGIYPYSTGTDKQRQAIQAIGREFTYESAHDLILRTAKLLLAGMMK